DEPVATDDSIRTNEETAISFSVLDNDTDQDNDPLLVDSFSQPSDGVVTDLGNGQLRYNPNEDFSGVDSFQYTIDDGNGGTDTGTVTVNVTDVPVTHTLSVAAINDVVPESAGDAEVFLFTRQDDEGDLTVRYDVSGTATAPDDFDALPATIQFLDGDLTATLDLSLINDDLVEGDESLQISIRQDPNYVIGQPSTADITVQDNDSVVLSVSQSSDAISESSATASVHLQLSNPIAVDTQIQIGVSGTAIQNMDYALSNTFITVPAGQVSASLQLQSIDNDRYQQDRRATLQFTAAGLNSESVDIDIVNDDVPSFSVNAGNGGLVVSETGSRQFVGVALNDAPIGDVRLLAAIDDDSE
ncbi:MAG: Ig-like domain-containing protein, partial [Planctomycetota bacterium]